MPAGTWSFKPELGPTLATVVVFSLLLFLGFWQMDRAGEKAALQDEYRRKSSMEPVDLNRDTVLRDNKDAMQGRRCIVRGRYTRDKAFLLDNQVLNGVAGYLVFSPFEITGADATVMVNRGWVPAGAYRDRVPEVRAAGDTLTLTGSAYLPPGPGLLGDAPAEAMAEDVDRVLSISLDELEDALDRNLLPYAVRLDPASPTAYADAGIEPGSGRERHLGYAFQWFALAGVLMIIYLYFSFHRKKPDDR
jgi:surfeit locus 1 family protein